MTPGADSERHARTVPSTQSLFNQINAVFLLVCSPVSLPSTALRDRSSISTAANRVNAKRNIDVENNYYLLITDTPRIPLIQAFLPVAIMETHFQRIGPPAYFSLR